MWLGRIGAVFLLVGLSSSAAAVCERVGGNVGVVSRSVDFGTVYVDATKPVGAELGTVSAFYAGGDCRCSTGYGGDGVLRLYKTPFKRPVYNANVPGVGIRIVNGRGAPAPFTVAHVAGTVLTPDSFTATLVKTVEGPISAESSYLQGLG